MHRPGLIVQRLVAAQRVGGALPADVVVDLVNSIAGDARRIQELATNGLITIADA